jgi:hypothetical protein
MKTWLEKYKNKQCKTIFGDILQRIVFTWIYKFYLSLILFGIGIFGGILSYFGLFSTDSFIYNIFYSILMIGVIILSLMIVGGVLYVFISAIVKFFKNVVFKK